MWCVGEISRQRDPAVRGCEGEGIVALEGNQNFPGKKEGGPPDSTRGGGRPSLSS